jgi:hypothetical protein
MIIYLVKSTLLLGLLLVLYKLFLENEKMHRFNRFFLLFALVFGLTAPLISFEIQPEQSIAGIQMQQMERVVNAPAEAVNRSVGPLIIPEQGLSPGSETTPDTVNKSKWSIDALDVILALYGSITLFLLIRFVAGLIQILNKVRAGTQKELDNATLILLEEPITPQSFLDYIFLEKQPFESGNIEPEILNHELTHVRQFHSFDVLLIEFLKVILWFNPLMYLYKHAIQLNHEFMADEAVVRSGSAISEYQELLIRVSAGNTSLKTTSNINFSLTKKRLKMMGKKISKIKVGAVWLFVLPLSVALIIVFSAQTDKYAQTISMQEIWDSIPQTTYQEPELHYDGNRSKELGIPLTLGAQYTSSGELFTGTQKVYYVENDSLWQELFYEDGIITGSVIYTDGDTIRQVHGIFEDRLEMGKEMYINGMMNYKDVRPHESKDGLGHVRIWHRSNGELAFEAFYTGDKVYQGLMTEYDEEGKIIMQERYEDGELIETIKEKP